MARSSLQISGLDQAIKRVDGVADRARDPLPRPVANEIKREIMRSEATRFRTGRGWRRLTPRWLAYKRARGFDERKLVMTGALEEMLTHGTGKAVWKATKYAVEFGLPRTRRYVAMAKARRPVMIDRDARQAIKMTVQRYVAGHGR